MTDFNTILENATQWVTESLTKPAIQVGQLISINQYTRGIVTRLITNEDELIGVISRQFYDPDSHDAWITRVVSSTLADLRNIIGCIKRICAEYVPTTAENIIQWEAGEYKIFNNKRFVFTFVLLIKKALVSEW